MFGWKVIGLLFHWILNFPKNYNDSSANNRFNISVKQELVSVWVQKYPTVG